MSLRELSNQQLSTGGCFLGWFLAANMSNSWLVTLAGLAQSRLEATGVVADFQGAVQGFFVPQERA